ncbi:MAG TPA: CbiX/SirB N-terminal domain-containing protein [Burkholderiales bacterium]|nr:CbiX/SirB N-terminal domain-containing protein [Burkholderiales bacterium]
MSSRAVILFAHGAREAEWARPFEKVRDSLRSEGLRVELAYLEIMTPSLEDAARVLVAEGVKMVTVVPLFLAQGNHLKQQLPERVAALRRDNASTEFRVMSALGDEPEVLAAITAWAKRVAR